MKNIQLTICNLQGKERADKLLGTMFDGLSRSRIEQLIDEKKVKINGEVVASASHKIKDRDLIEIEIPAPRPSTITPKDDIPLDIVYEDDDLMVINKQAGLTVHPGAGNHDDTLVNALVSEVDDLSGINGVMRPGIVHRLDRDTSGLMLVAKNDVAHRFLAEGIQSRDVKRVYHALVWNCPQLPGGKVELNLGRHPRDRKKMSVLKRTGKEAITHYQIVKKYFGGVITLLQCQLETGRTHQIRVHMEHKGWPLVGDQTYYGNQNQKKTGSLPEAVRNAVANFPRQALCAKYIAFTHPTTFEEMEFEIDYPKDFKKLLDIIEKNV
jgi:23S rRNA pseudouridine1911/1915/1917 synthase